MYVRTRYLILWIVVSDITLVSGGYPLLRYTWMLLESHHATTNALLVALLGNLGLLCLAAGGLIAATMLAQRGAWFLLRRYAEAYARPASVRQTPRSR